MEKHSIPQEVVAEAEAVLGLEMPQDPKSKAFQHWLQNLYEEDAGLAAELAAHLKHKPPPNPSSPLEQERRRLLRGEAIGDWWKRIWNVENQYGEWVPNQKRRVAAGGAGAMLVLGLLLLVMGQKPLKETKIEGSLGKIAGVSSSPPAQTSPLGEDSALMPKAGAQSPAGLGIGATSPAVAAVEQGQTASSQTPAVSPSLGFENREASAQPEAGFTPKLYPSATSATSAPSALGRLGHNQAATNSAALVVSSPLPTQSVPVMIRQPGFVLPRAEGAYLTATRPGPAMLNTQTNPSPQAIGGAGTAAQIAMADRVGEPTRASAVAKGDARQLPLLAGRPSPTAVYAVSAQPVQGQSAQALTPSSALSYSRSSSVAVGTQTPTQNTALAISSPQDQGVSPSQASAAQLPRVNPLSAQSFAGISQGGSVAYVKPRSKSPTSEPIEPPQSGQMLQLSPSSLRPVPTAKSDPPSSNPLPSLQTPTNLARDFLAGLDPAQPIAATLDANVLLVEGVSVLARAVSQDGGVWLGKASLDPLRRISINFTEVIQQGRRIPVTAVAYDGERNPGLAAEFRDEDPSLVQDLLRQGAQAANGYLQSLLQSGSTTTLPGGGSVQDHSAPPLEWQLLGELGKLFTLPQPQNSFVRTARVNRGTPLLIFLQPQADPVK